MAKIDAFFNLMNETGASDLHLASGSQPILRVRGELERVKFPPLENDDLKSMLYEIAPEFKVKIFEETGDVDFGYEIPGKARYRPNRERQVDDSGCNHRLAAPGWAGHQHQTFDRPNRERQVDDSGCNHRLR